MIKAITFDLDGVYFPNGKANFIKAVESLGVAPDEVKRVFLKSDEMNEQYKKGTMTDDQYWTYAAKEWNLSLSPQELIGLLIQGYDVDPRVEEFIGRVRAKGYKTLVCSNNFPARVNGLQAKFGFLDNFDAAVFSHEVGDIKPSERIFNELVERSGVPAEAIAFADDEEEKLAGATAIGITTFVYTDFDQFVRTLQELGVEIDA